MSPLVPTEALIVGIGSAMILVLILVAALLHWVEQEREWQQFTEDSKSQDVPTSQRK